MPRLLLVEDEQVNRDLFRRRLERKGYVVISAECGLQAVALTQSEKPDLVLMDLGLPDIDGWEATRRIKGNRAIAAIPVVVLSAHATTDAREKAFAAGCEEFETKPVNWESLFKKIEEALARAKARAATPPEDEIDFGSGAPDPMAATNILRTTQAPRVPPESEPEVPLAMAVEEEVCTVQPKRILIAEDDDPNRAMLCRRMKNSGYMTAEAADGRHALDQLAKCRFDLVLCDILMPGVDGYEVLRAMKADPDLRAIPIIMISALHDTASVIRCIDMGAEDYLQKPYDPVLLLARINACLDKRRLRDQEIAFLSGVAHLTRAAERVEQGTFDPALLATVTARNDALGTLARVFVKMANEVQAREQQLRSDVQKFAAVGADHRGITQEAPRVSDAVAFDEARARRPQQAPKPGTETLILPAKPK